MGRRKPDRGETDDRLLPLKHACKERSHLCDGGLRLFVVEPVARVFDVSDARILEELSGVRSLANA